MMVVKLFREVGCWVIRAVPLPPRTSTRARGLKYRELPLKLALPGGNAVPRTVSVVAVRSRTTTLTRLSTVPVQSILSGNWAFTDERPPKSTIAAAPKAAPKPIFILILIVPPLRFDKLNFPTQKSAGAGTNDYLTISDSTIKSRTYKFAFDPGRVKLLRRNTLR